jgi:rubrerythrin
MRLLQLFHGTVKAAVCGCYGREENMALRFLLSLVVIAGVFFVFGRATADQGQRVSQLTQRNLSAAMHGEAFAYAKYSLYAKRARQNGNDKLADLFEEAANTERLEHFGEEAQLAGLVGNDPDNLKDAIEGESYEVDTMYRQFANEATAAGDDVAAARFEEIRHDEMKHRDAFKDVLAKVESKTTVARQD